MCFCFHATLPHWLESVVLASGGGVSATSFVCRFSSFLSLLIDSFDSPVALVLMPSRLFITVPLGSLCTCFRFQASFNLNQRSCKASLSCVCVCACVCVCVCVRACVRLECWGFVALIVHLKVQWLFTRRKKKSNQAKVSRQANDGQCDCPLFGWLFSFF